MSRNIKLDGLLDYLEIHSVVQRIGASTIMTGCLRALVDLEELFCDLDVRLTMPDGR